MSSRIAGALLAVSLAVAAFVGAASASVTVVVPNGGESYEVGDVVDIQWSTGGVVPTVDVRLSRNNGTDWETIASDIPNTDSYVWTVTAGSQPLPQDQCLIRVQSHETPTDNDDSDAVFSIAEYVELIWNGSFEEGEIWWSAMGGSFAVVTSDAHTGTRSAHVTGRSETWHSARQYVIDRIQNDTDYTISFWIKLDSLSTEVRLTMNYDDDAGSHWANFASMADVPAGTWVQITGTSHLTWNGTLTSARVYITVANATTDYFLDDVTITYTGAVAMNVEYPRHGMPAIVQRGSDFMIKCRGGYSASAWSATLQADYFSRSLAVSAVYVGDETWELTATVPANGPVETYDLVVDCSDGSDSEGHAVKIVSGFPDQYYFMVSDSVQGANDDFRAVLAEVNVINPEFFILTGDNIQTAGNEVEFQALIAAEVDTMVPLCITAGNHDIGSTKSGVLNNAATWNRYFGPRYWSFDRGNYHFTCVESSMQHFGDYENSFEDDDPVQIEWLKADLAASMSSTFQVVFCHIFKNNSGNAFDWHPSWLWTDYKVRLALSGHNAMNYIDEHGTVPTTFIETRDIKSMRAFRLIRVDGSSVSYDYNGDPLSTLVEGKLTVGFSPANDGTNSTVTATVTNNHLEHFEQGLLRFLMPIGSYNAVGGALWQAVDSDDSLYTVCYVSLDIPASDTAVVTVQPGVGLPSLSIGDVSLNEGDAGTTSFDFQVTISEDPAAVVAVDYDTTEGTATLADSDYADTSGQLQFDPGGGLIQTVSVQVTGDTKPETDEDFTVVLGNPVNATISDGTGGGTILDDDGGVTVVDTRVNASSDDAEEYDGGATVNLNSTDLEFCRDVARIQIVGMRFNNVTVPVGATITTAYIQFTTDEVSTGTAPDLTIYGEDNPVAPTFVVAANNISSRTRVPATIAWTPASWPVIGEAGPDQRTPDISSIVQDIIEVSGWAAGNSLVILIDDLADSANTRIADSYDDDPLTAPVLHVEYTTGSPVPTVQWAVASQSVDEGAGTVNVRAELSATATENIVVSYGIGGDATPGGTDYDTLSGSFTIATGTDHEDIPVVINNDMLEENDETVVLTMTTVTSGTADLGAILIHTVTIVDNDGGKAEDDDDNGCGCAASTGAGGTAALAVFLAGLIVLHFRRRLSWPRQTK